MLSLKLRHRLAHLLFARVAAFAKANGRNALHAFAIGNAHLQFNLNRSFESSFFSCFPKIRITQRLLTCAKSRAVRTAKRWRQGQHMYPCRVNVRQRRPATHPVRNLACLIAKLSRRCSRQFHEAALAIVIVAFEPCVYFVKRFRQRRVRHQVPAFR